MNPLTGAIEMQREAQKIAKEKYRELKFLRDRHIAVHCTPLDVSRSTIVRI